MLTITACGSVPAPTQSVIPASTSSPLEASTDEWAREGTSLIAGKQAASKENPDMLNAGDWAYQSNPVDITGDGKYVLTFTVQKDFVISPTADRPVIGVSFTYPRDQAFRIRQAGPLELTQQADGTTKLTVPFMVSDVRSEYPGYSVWIS
ncbi:hypothetical protein ACWEOW_01305 [Monashia sp. NPDC004114]